MMDKKNKLNVITIGFLISTIMCFGGLHFFFDKYFINTLLNYYIIVVCAIAILILFFNNKECFKITNIKKIPLILSIIVMIWFTITSIFGISFSLTNIKSLINFGELLVLLNVIINIDFLKEEKDYIIRITLIAFLITAILGIIQYFTGINLVTHTNKVYPGILGRICSTFYIATLYDKFVVIILPIIFYNLLKDKNKYLNNILLLLSGIAITLTFSRSGIFVFCFLLMIYFIIFLFKKKIFNIFSIILTVLFMLMIPGTTYVFESGVNHIYKIIKTPEKYQINLLSLNDFFEKYVYSIFDSKEDKIIREENKIEKNKDTEKNKLSVTNDNSAKYRTKYQNVGKEFIKEYPVFGVGIGNYSYLYNNQNYKDYLKDDSVLGNMKNIMYPHNGYVHLTAETGYIGTILLILTIISFFAATLIKDKSYIWERVCALTILFSMLIACYTESIFHNKQYIYLTLILFVFFCTKNKELINDKKKIKKGKKYA